MRRDGAAPLIGSSTIMRGVRERIERVAATDFTVLIEGESGTGKELVARQIHEISRRRAGRSSPSTARRSSKRCSRPSSSASKTAPPPACAAGAASSSTPTAARCSSTRSAICRCRRRPSCCARSRIWRSSGSAGQGLHRVDTRVVAATNKPLQRAGRGARVSGRSVLPRSRASRFTCRRCASGAKTSSSWPCYFLDRHRDGRHLRLSRPVGRCACSPTTGRGMCASSNA